MIISGERSFPARTLEVASRSTRKTFAGGLPEDRFSSAEQARALPLAYGQFQLGAAFIAPIWGDHKEKSDGSKKLGGALGYEHFGYYAIAFCLGPITELTELRVADKAIWTGPLTLDSGNQDGVVITTDLGSAIFKWGTEVQTATTEMAAVHAQQPGLRGACYLVPLDWSFGTIATPPQVTLIGKRQLAALSISQHSLSGDAVLPEVLYDILTHPRYGARVLAERIDKDSFEAAAETIIGEDLGASPVFREAATLREAVAKLLTYMRGVRYFTGGKIALKLIRDDPAEVATEITSDDLEDPPEPEAGDWASTWGMTRISYTNAANNWERDVYAYPNAANARIRGYWVPQDVDREWFTRLDVAKREAAIIGTGGGLPLASYAPLRLKPSFRTVRPGQLLKLVYPKLNISAAYLRAEKVTVGGPDDPAVTIHAVGDPSRQTTLGYLPSGSESGQPGYTRPPLVAPTVRVATLTSELKEGYADGLLVAFSRPTGLSVRHETYFTWDPAQASYGRLAQGTAFPVFGTIVWWLRTAAGWVFRFRVAATFDAGSMAAIAESFQDYYFVAGRRVVVTSPADDDHKLLCVLAKRRLGGRFAAISADTFDVEVEAAQQGTEDLALETLAAGASAPTGMAFFGLLDTFTILRSDSLAFDRNQGNDPADAALRRYIKTVVGDDQSLLALADVSATELKRLDTSMDPAGSYSPDWGSRAKTAYELTDDECGLQYAGTPGADYAQVSDLDEALGRVYEGTASADDTALLSDLDEVLGAYLSNANGIYNDSP